MLLLRGYKPGSSTQGNTSHELDPAFQKSENRSVTSSLRLTAKNMSRSSNDQEKRQSLKKRSPPGQNQSASMDPSTEQVHEPDNYHELWAPRFRQIQSQGPSKKDEQYDPKRDLTWLSKLRRNLREPLAEFLGVFIMICFGDGSVAQVNLSNNEYGEYQSISWCWGIGVMMGVYIAGGISGGHLNPAVTLANCLYRRFPWSKLLPFAVAQILVCLLHHPLL
jgi:hypothetical protein